MKNKKTIYTIIGAIILGLISFATMCADVPEIYSPFSMSVIIPVFLFDWLFYAMFPGLLFPGLHFVFGCLVIPILYVVWSYRLYKNTPKIPRRSISAILILFILSLVYLIGSWSYGLGYQGITHTISMYIFNCIFWGILYYLYMTNRKKPSFITSYLFHLVSFAWLAWVAFPWLGELI